MIKSFYNDDFNVEEHMKQNRKREKELEKQYKELENERILLSNQISLAEFIVKATGYDIYKNRGYVCMRRKYADYQFDLFVKRYAKNSNKDDKVIIHLSKEYIIYMNRLVEEDCIFFRKRGV